MIVFGNRVLCLVVLFLLQSAGWMAMAEEDPLISVRMKNHLYYRGEDITSDVVTYDVSKTHCEKNGGYILSAYTKDIRTKVMESIRSFGRIGEKSFFIGADMEYSVHKETDPTKKCDYAKPSLNCIIKWNQGVWADALGDGVGVGFYKGDPKKVDGSSLINGYDVTVESSWDYTRRPYIVSVNSIPEGASFLVYNIREKETSFPRTDSLCICEVQEGIIKPTEAPTNTNNKSQNSGSGVSGTSGKSDGLSGLWKRWGVVVVITLCFLATLIIMLYIYRCVRKCRRKAVVRRVTEEPRAITRTDREESVMRKESEAPNKDTASCDVMNPLVKEDKRGILRNTWIETPQQANAMVPADGAVPRDSDAAAEQQSRRLGNMRRAQPIRRRPTMPELVILP